MAKYALVFQGRVVEIAAAPFPVAAALQWVDVTQMPTPPEVEWSYVGGVFAPPTQTEPTLDEQKQRKLDSINAAFEVTAAALTAGYPAAETLTWPDQKTEVVAWLADNDALTPYIDALATAREIDRLDYINKTLTKVSMFRAASAALVGKRQKLADQIQAATNVEELNLIQW